MIMVLRSPCPSRLTQRDRLPYLVATRARQQRPLLKNGSRLRVEAPTVRVSDQDGHRTTAQVVQREALEGLIVGCATLAAPAAAAMSWEWPPRSAMNRQPRLRLRLNVSVATRAVGVIGGDASRAWQPRALGIDRAAGD